MAETAELGGELTARIDRHLAAGETHEAVVEELLDHYESEGNLLWEGYGGEPLRTARSGSGRRGP